MADRLSLKWIDGNDVVTVSGVTSTDVHIHGNTENVPDFDVDDPNFWTPLSVISGLASGFCERRAVLNSMFITGSTTSGGSAVDIETDWTADSTGRDAIVSNCVANLVLGSSGDANLYKPADATMRLIGAAATSNYMTAMDAAITTIIGTTAAFVAEVTGSAITFDTLATNATATASAAGSSLDSTITSNGTDYAKSMYPGLPAEWAKERKWMLDELRWAYSDVDVQLDSTYEANVFSGTITGNSVFHSAGTTSPAAGLGVELNTASGLRSSTKTVTAACYGLSGTILSAGSSANTTMYFGAAGFEVVPVDFRGMKYITSSATAVAGNNYCVCPGGTLVISTNIIGTTGGGTVVVAAGGTVSMATSVAYVDHMEINAGGVVQPFQINGLAYAYADAITHDYVKPTVLAFEGAVGPSIPCASNGGTYSTGNIAVLSGVSCTISGGGGSLGTVYVSGGTATISGSIGAEHLLIEAGGVVHAVTDGDFGRGQAWIGAGGILTMSLPDGNQNFTGLYNATLAGGTITALKRCYINNIDIYEGSLLDFHGPALSDTPGNSAKLIYCCPFGLAGHEASGAGWVPVTATLIESGGSQYQLLGTSDVQAGLANVSAYVSTYFPTINSRIMLISKGSAPIPADPNLVTKHIFSGGVTAEYVATPLAVNSRALTDHYPSFYVRQFPTPAEQEEAAQIISSASQA